MPDILAVAQKSRDCKKQRNVNGIDKVEKCLRNSREFPAKPLVLGERMTENHENDGKGLCIAHG